MLKTLVAKVQAGHGVASGKSEKSPYPAGTIAMQRPYFKARGLDLSSYFAGTLNLSISPNTFAIQHADFYFKQLQWARGFPPEDFSFVSCRLFYEQTPYSAYIYYPHPETKLRHFHSSSVIEVLAEKIEGIQYTDTLELEYDSNKIKLFTEKPNNKSTK